MHMGQVMIPHSKHHGSALTGSVVGRGTPGGEITKEPFETMTRDLEANP